jgi:KRAB domain-containing zinc finger protein
VGRDGLSNHKKYVHLGKTKDVQCPHCDLKLFSQAKLKIHLKGHFKTEVNERFQCNQCPKSEFEIVRLKILINLLIKIMKGFSTASYLKYHIEEHQDTYRKECCQSIFKTHSEWTKHCSLHKSEAKSSANKLLWKCEICSKEFQTKTWLDNHKLSHSGIKNFPCTFEGCDRAFSLQKVLTRHLFTVHYKSTFNCELCNLTMDLKEKFHKTYGDHIRRCHLELGEQGILEFEKKIKKLRFKDVSNEFAKDLHAIGIRTHKSECPECHINFRSNQLLIQHYKQVHPDCRDIND